MKFAEAWRLSRVPYREVVYRSLAEERGRMWWGAFGRKQLDKEGRGETELAKRVLRIARFDKIIVAVFNVIASVMPFSYLFLGSPVLALASSISLSLAVTFGFTALYAIQTLSSFVSAESSALLSTLPLSRDDFSLITLLSFVRSVDYLVVGSVLSQVVLVAYLSASPLATLLTFVASVANAVLAVAAALWLSRLFHRNLMRGERSKRSTVLRLVFILMWGSLLMSVGLLLSLPWYIVPQLERSLLNLDQISSLFVCLLYPFSAGVTIANVVYPNVSFSITLTTSVVLIGYLALAVVAGWWSLRTVRHMSQESGARLTRVVTKDFSIKTRGPLLGYVTKDLRISSRNPATAFSFAFPVLETLVVSLLIMRYSVLRASTVLVATTMGAILALFMPLALLSSEGKGLEYAKTLPLKVDRIVTSKAIISTAAYVPVPLTLLIMALVRPLTSPVAVLIPCVTVLSVAAASILETKLFLDYATGGRVAALILDLERLTAGVAIALVPEIAYAAAYFVSFNHAFAILAMSGVAAAELAVTVHSLK